MDGSLNETIQRLNIWGLRSAGGFFQKIGKSVLPKNWRKVLSPLLILLIWELIARMEWVPRWFLPVPTHVLQTLYEITVSGELFGHTGISLFRALVGYSLGAIVGVSLGAAHRLVAAY